MRAMVIQDGFGIDSLKMVEREVPEPKTGEVLVRVKPGDRVMGIFMPVTRLSAWRARPTSARL